MSDYNLLEQLIQDKKFSNVKNYFNKHGNEHGLSKDELNNLLIKSIKFLVDSRAGVIGHSFGAMSLIGNHPGFDDDEDNSIDIDALILVCIDLIENGANYNIHAGKTKRSAKLNSLVSRFNPELNYKLQSLHDRNSMRSNYKEEAKSAKPKRQRLF